ncbi:MAG: 3D-(3,5/4)-trihydroxycyclohexane-1,2-dione acylhydrolase (decyclizing) [Pirellulales bacterium]
MNTRRLTAAQALIEFLAHQQTERDGARQPLFAGCWGIFGHGNVAGIGQALLQTRALRYYQCRNEQAMVHAAVAYARMKNRLSTFVCTSSIGPGATNMVTGAALATINRLPVLLLPGDLFAKRSVAPVLQQLESPGSQDASVNDCFRPVSKYWDRIHRSEQLITALPEAMRVLTSPADTGAVTLCMPQDVQTEAFDYPVDLFEERVWHIPRPLADPEQFERAVAAIRASRSPLIIAGGGVLYSEATEALDRFCRQTGIPSAETQAGKGSLHYQHPQQLGAVGVTGTPGANMIAREADLIIGIGTRYSDFTTSSKTAFQHPDLTTVNVNVAAFDAHKHRAIPLVADARATLDQLSKALADYRVPDDYRQRVADLADAWEQEVERIYSLGHGPPVSQGEVIGAVNHFSDPRDVVVCAAGSLPGDLHKLWRTRDPKGYHVEYGYSCMGYEIAGGVGVKMADASREVYVMLGDGSYLMMAQEIVTAVQEGLKIVVVLLDNHGFSSIGGLSAAVGCGGFGTRYRVRGPNGELDGDHLPIDFAANLASLGAHTERVRTIDELNAALHEAKRQAGPAAIVVETDLEQRVPGYEAWWDVAVAEVSEVEAVRQARAAYVDAVKKERYFL